MKINLFQGWGFELLIVDSSQLDLGILFHSYSIYILQLRVHISDLLTFHLNQFLLKIYLTCTVYCWCALKLVCGVP